MMAGVDVFSHPFRLTAGGDVAVVEEGSDTAAAEAIIVLAGTRPGERALVPGFGLADPTFGDGAVDLAGLNAGLELYGPTDVSVDDAAITPSADGRTATVDLTFTNGSSEEVAVSAGS